MKIWQYNTLPIDNLRQQCIDTVILKKPEDISYELLSIRPSEILLSENIKGQSNELRFKILSEDSNSQDVWLDTDVRLVSWWIPPEDGKIYANDSFSVIFSNGNNKIFKDLYTSYNSLPPDNGSGKRYLDFFKSKDIVRKIPENKFQHLGLSMVNNRSFYIIANNECATKREKNTLSFTWIRNRAR